MDSALVPRVLLSANRATSGEYHFRNSSRVDGANIFQVCRGKRGAGDWGHSPFLRQGRQEWLCHLEMRGRETAPSFLRRLRGGRLQRITAVVDRAGGGCYKNRSAWFSRIAQGRAPFLCTGQSCGLGPGPTDRSGVLSRSIWG